MSERPVEMDDLHFLTDWGVLQDHSRTRNARLLSILLHVGVVVTWLLLPKSITDPVRQAVVRQITPLIEPLTDLTQPTPNRGKLNKEFNLESQAPRPHVHVPASPPPAPVMAPARRMAIPAEKKPPAPAPNLPDAPNVQVAQQMPAAPPMAPPTPPPPQLQPQEKPKLTLENPLPATTGKGTGLLPPPSTSVQDALRAVVRNSGAGGMVVGDVDLMSGPSARSSINAPALPGKSGAYMELKFDPKGVDFRPYLIQILATIKRNWFAVWPESARMGRQGRVGIQIAVARNGNVTKLVIAAPSGADPLDKAAVSGISASNPLPELPGTFAGNEIRLQLNFVYNLK